MDDQVLVGVLHRGTDIEENLEALLRGEVAGSAPFEQGRSLHVLHDEIGLPVGRRSPVEQPRDVRMIEARDDLPLGSEAAIHLIARDADSRQLDRDSLLEVLVGPPGEVDNSHTAVPDLFDDLVHADPLSRRHRAKPCRERGCGRCRRLHQAPGFLL